VPAPVRIGLAGYGLGGRYFHAPLLASAPDCEFLGVVTTSPERRRQVATDLARPAFASLQELASAGADAVAISTPAATHVTLTQEALRLGLAVACDKPFAPDAGSARQTVELAGQLGVPLTVYQNRRWDSDFLTLRELLGNGSLGELTVFESRFERFRPDPGPPAAGGGTSGSYLIADADGQEARLRSGASPASADQRWGAEPPKRWGHLLRGDTAELVPSARGAWDLFYPAFAAAIRGTQPVPVDPWDAVATAAVLDAARTSARTRQVIRPAQTT
jgi:predicted dehydrogenase